jgi:aryl-alcohol dehydrogenase-like predicted oxidoreductase
MRYRLFGPTGLRVSELFLGAMTFGEQGGVGPLRPRVFHPADPAGRL